MPYLAAGERHDSSERRLLWLETCHLTRVCSCRGPQRLSRRRVCFFELVGGGFGRPPQLKRSSLCGYASCPVLEGFPNIAGAGSEGEEGFHQQVDRH